MSIERRRHKRITVSLEAKLEGLHKNYPARVSDISVGGCYVETVAQVSVGEIVQVDIYLPTGKWLSLRGEVLYFHQTIGFGLRFLQLSQLEMEMLNHLILYSGDE
jgi:hypothetical protein